MGKSAARNKKVKKAVKKSGKKFGKKSKKTATCRQRYAKDLRFLSGTASKAKRLKYLACCKHKKGLFSACRRVCAAILKRPEAYYKSEAAFLRDKSGLLSGRGSDRAISKALSVSGRGFLKNILSGLLEYLPI